MSNTAQPMRTLVVSDEQFVALIDRKLVEFNDLPQISRLGQFEGGCVATVRSESNAGYSIEVRVSRIGSKSIRLDII